VDLRLQRDLDVQVKVKTQPQRVALALVAAALVLDSIAGDITEGTGHAVHHSAGGVLDAVEGEVVERAATALLLPLWSLTPSPRCWWLVRLLGGLFTFGLVCLRLLGGALRLVF